MIKFKGLTLLFALTTFAFSALSADLNKVSFNDGWKFSKGKLVNAQKNSYDDRQWQSVTLPHDWSIEGPFDDKYNARNGGLPVFGNGWYRKSFTLPKSVKGKHVSVTFDAAMNNSKVYINGHLLGERPFGYIAFEYDLTPYLTYGDKPNVIAVSLAPENFSARWYAGAGIYRNTWLDINDDVHVAKWGTFVSTPKVTRQYAQVKLETKINNKGKATSAQIRHIIRNSDGDIVTESSSVVDKLKANSQQTLTHHFNMKNPILWDTENPYLYQIETLVIKNDTVVDRYTTPLGVRHIEYKADDGFWLNWRRVQIQGVCLHHDNGPLGAVANHRAIERKLQIMKDMGANSIRTSHNPPSPELVQLADEMGILLQVESFDVWKIEKNTVVNGYHKDFDQWHERDLRDMIRQNRNSPSVIMWSTGNEIMEQGDKDGWKVAKTLSDIARDEDPTRLVAAGFNNPNGAIKNKLADEVDIVGLNYKPTLYDDIHKEHPSWIKLASETSSVTSTRGKYHFPMDKYSTHDSRYVTSYDIVGPVWAYPPDIEFEYLARNPSVMGEYIWTGFDYLGEPTPYGGKDHSDIGYWNHDWPARSSSFGAVDLVGFPKDRFYLYQSQWTDTPMVHVLPHWNWPTMKGQSIPVYAYTNAEEVELFVNGKSFGKKVKGVDKAELPIDFKRWDKEDRPDYKTPYRLRWDVKYQPGELKVVAYNKGKVVAEKVIKTAGEAVQATLTPDRAEISADGYDLSYVTVEVQDEHGNMVPTAENKIRFFVEGAGEIAAVGNGDSATVEPFKADYRRAFSGKAMLIVKSIKGQKGKINIRAYADGLNIKPITLQAK
ncbi:glycoside hydrolase family 2 TIM barrel-domain containing protein [Thalassotalea sp. PLHSN55]|uniref:glycoside hydrolase family 2 TIM barrel-domain containing protein n=1 Tax=Thalassotalea sp. PLHSN55 TaxID=3435888 RepID=UPI003F85CADD